MKKITALIILVFMISSLLVGCSEKAMNEKENNQTNLGDKNEEDLGGEVKEENNPSLTPDKEPESEDATESDSKVDNEPETEPEPKPEPEPEPEPKPEPEPEPAPEFNVGTAVGDLMASVTLEKVGGGTVSIEDFKGKIIIFNIWATWCPPCKAELPDFDKIAKEYSDEVVVIAAHLPSGSENAPSYVATNFPDSKIHFAYDTSNYAAFLAAGGVNSVPRTVILDQRGVIVYAQDGMMYYEQLISIIESIKGQ